eukprot:jgi/Ulvmu1/8896/UM049_0078.1
MISMKARTPVGTSRAVAARAVHGKTSFPSKAAAVAVGAALQLTVLSHGFATAGERLVAGPNLAQEASGTVESKVEESKKAIDQGASKVSNELGGAPDVGQAAEDAKNDVKSKVEQLFK